MNERDNRNLEKVKLAANFVSRCASGCINAGVIVPGAAAIFGVSSIDSAILIFGSLAFLVGGLLLHWWSMSILNSLDDDRDDRA